MRRIGTVAAALVLAALLPTSAPTASAAEGCEPQTAPGVNRIWGDDRILTAVCISQNDFSGGSAAAAVLAKHSDFPDALAGTPFAVAKGAPILLTPTDSLHPATHQELSRVLPSGRTVYLLGGPEALSESIDAQLIDMGYEVIRLWGATRFETAVAVAEASGEPASIFLATGMTFHDALSGGVAAAEVGGVVILTAGETYTQSAREYVDARGHLPRYAIGSGPQAADPDATAVGGADPYENAQLVAERFFPEPPVVAVTSGATFPDSLAGGPHIAARHGPVLFTEPTGLNHRTASYVRARSDVVDTAFIYGGPEAVHGHVDGELQDALADETTTPDDVAPAGERSLSDRPDPTAEYQVHAIYAMPSDATDQQRDLNGQIRNSVSSFQSWLARHSGGPALRMDTYEGQLDISFARLPRPDSEYVATGDFVRDEIEKDLRTAGFDHPRKIYAVFWEGGSSKSCGGGAYPPDLIGKVAAIYLNGTPPGAPACSTEPLGASATVPDYADFGMLHEIVHTLGYVAGCAPNHTAAGHVSDDPRDLMYAGGEPWEPEFLDVGSDDYFGTGRQDCIDMAQSAFMDPLPAGSHTPPGW